MIWVEDWVFDERMDIDEGVVSSDIGMYNGGYKGILVRADRVVIGGDPFAGEIVGQPLWEIGRAHV